VALISNRRPRGSVIWRPGIRSSRPAAVFHPPLRGSNSLASVSTNFRGCSQKLSRRSALKRFIPAREGGLSLRRWTNNHQRPPVHRAHRPSIGWFRPRSFVYIGRGRGVQRCQNHGHEFQRSALRGQDSLLQGQRVILDHDLANRYRVFDLGKQARLHSRQPNACGPFRQRIALDEGGRSTLWKTAREDSCGISGPPTEPGHAT